MRFAAAIFDLDGTLLDTLDDLAGSANRVLHAFGLPGHPVESYRYFVGEGMIRLVERILPAGRRDNAFVARVAEAFREDYGRHWKDKSRMYNGVPVMLDGLAADGVKLAILSNKPHDFTRACVRDLLPGFEFDPVFGQRPGIPRKPDPAAALEIAAILGHDPADILYLGDTATDMETAVRAGMFAVGALWGFRSREELEQSGARAVAGRPEDVLQLVRAGAGPA
ncbi:MAG TPA: HAD family hydrolase [Desulfobulbus sp.]|nr:HAD family hydrolase [Desulfobulbus sp.]